MLVVVRSNVTTRCGLNGPSVGERCDDATCMNRLPFVYVFANVHEFPVFGAPNMPHQGHVDEPGNWRDNAIQHHERREKPGQPAPLPGISRRLQHRKGAFAADSHGWQLACHATGLQ